MRRRAFLRAGLGLGVATVGPARGGPVISTGGDSNRGYGPLNGVRLPGAADCRVAADGETAFVAVGDGFVTVGVPAMEPLSAVRGIAADRDRGPLEGIRDLALDGDRLLVPGPADTRAGRLAGAALYDVSDRRSPRELAFHETDFAVHNAALADGRAYLTSGRALVIVDVTTEETVEVGRWALTDADPRWRDVPPRVRVLHDVRVRGDLAVLSYWDAGTWLVDVSDPEAVSVVGRAGGRPAAELAGLEGDAVRRASLALPGNHHSAALSSDGSVLAVGAEAFAVGSTDHDRPGPGGIDLYDVSDPTTPRRLSTIDAPRAADETRAGTWTTAHDFAFEGDRLLSAWYQGGVRVHDVADPGAPRELAWWRQPDRVAFWTARPAVEDAFVASATGRPGRELLPGLFLFLNIPGRQTDPPSLTDPSTPVRTTAPAPTASPTPTDTRPPTRTPGQPGFGPAAALLGVGGLAAWRRWRSR